MKIEVSLGEIIDKVTILKIKLDKIKDTNKSHNIKCEYIYLSTLISKKINKNKQLLSLYNYLLEVNSNLWKIEDDIRLKESLGVFDNSFIELARSVYINNDLRAKIKKQINIIGKSKFIEEKSYV
jgi:hypothetical protein